MASGICSEIIHSVHLEIKPHWKLKQILSVYFSPLAHNNNNRSCVMNWKCFEQRVIKKQINLPNE